MSNARSAMLIAISILFLLPAHSTAETIFINFQDLGPVSCGSTWTEQGIVFEITQIPANHPCTGSCFPGADETGLWLYPSALSMDMHGTTGVLDVEIDIVEADPSLTATAWLYYNDGQTAVDGAVSGATGASTLRLNAELQDVDLLTIDCCECLVVEVRLIGDAVVDDDRRTWSTMKSSF